MQQFLFILLILCLWGCSTAEITQPIMKEDINYQRDAQMEVLWARDGKWVGPRQVTGMGIIPMSSHYRVKVMPPGKADMITVTSCHREIKTPRPDKQGGGWFSKGHYEFTIPITGTVDQKELCSLDIGIYEREKGRHAWGTLAVEDNEKFKLHATANCNGEVIPYKGVSVCQAKKGLIQEYIFDRPVSYAKVIGCEIQNLASEEKYAKTWRFVMPEGQCQMYFIDVNDPIHMVHQAWFFGYDTIPIRGIE
jgi:hypothetical protein